MFTDERPSAPPPPAGFREWLLATVRHRAGWSPAASPHRSFVRAQLVRTLTTLVVIALAVGAWLLLRPASHPDIATLLPRADATGSASSTAGPSGASGAPVVGRADASGASGTTATVLVHVVGAVATPGVVRVAPGARVLDAVAAAGGAAPEADLTRVNLAAKLTDGQRVAVPHVGDPPGAPAVEADPAADGVGGSTAAAPVDLNNATAAQLDTLPGVGPSTAAAIIAHRLQHGPFRTIDALGDVKGIGSTRLEQLRPLVTV